MNYHDILHDNMINGDGLRVVLFVSGCSIRCPNCQNPQTWDENSGIPFDQDAVNEIYEDLKKDYVSGITLTGGHPLEHYNLKACTDLCKDIKKKFPDKTIWLYTGYVYENVSNYEIMNYVDVCVDGPYVEKLRNIQLKWRGSSNQRVIDVPKTKQSGEIVLHCD